MPNSQTNVDLENHTTNLTLSGILESDDITDGIGDSSLNEPLGRDFLPYAVQSFNDAIRMVIADDVFKCAISDDGIRFVQKFQSITENAKLLSARLFGRVQVLFRENELSKILTSGSGACTEELVAAEILSADIHSLETSKLVRALNRQEITHLALKYNVKDGKKLKMAELADILLKKSTSSPLGNFFRTNVDMEKLFKNEISRVIGKCWRLNRASMRYLAIVLWLTSLGSEPSSAGPSHARSVEAELKTELYNMSLVRRGEVIYPAYEIRRKSVIYRTPEEAQQYLDLFDLELKLDYFVTNKEFQSAMCLFDPIQSHLLNLVHCASYRRDDVPIFLRRFTLPYRAFRILLLGIDLFERKREYEKAVVLIRELLFQSAAMAGQISEVCPLDAIGPCRASRLLVRLLIDEGNHLKRPMAAVSSVCNFMGIQNGVQGVSARSCVRAGQRLSVQEQLNKVFESFNSAKSHLRPPENGDQIKPKRRRVSAAKAETTEQIDASVQFSCPLLVEELMQAPKVEISAPVNATSKEIGTSRPHYLWKELPSPKKKRSPVKCSPSSPKEVAEPETLLLNVEQWVLRHYTSHLGYEHGMHSESQVFQLLFVLLFYDLLFDTSLPDVFYSYRQSAPLDLFTDEFYRSRRQAIDERLKWIREASKGNQEEVPLSDSVDENITNCWHAHHGERCLWANWDLFDKPEDVSDLFWCLGPAVVHTVCRQLAVDYRSWHSGLPDLVVWSPSKRQAKIIEVKGPGDHLSTQQMMWLDVLVRAGADVEVCHVSAVPYKSLLRQK